MAMGGPRAPRARWGGLGVMLLAGLTACDGGSAPTAVLGAASQAFSGLGPLEARFLDVQVTVTGTLTATADWTSPSNDLDLYVTETSCADATATDLFAGRCPFLARSTATNSKPEVVQANVTPGNLRIWVANFGPGTESGTLAVTVPGR